MFNLISSRWNLRLFVVALLASLALAAPCRAQQGIFKLDKLEIGFPQYGTGDGAFKSGLWTPVYATFLKTEEGNIVLPLAKDGLTRAFLTCAVSDAEGTQGVYKTSLELGRFDKTTVVTYANPGTMVPEPNLAILPGSDGQGSKITLSAKTALGNGMLWSVPMDGTLYLNIGTPLPMFDKAIKALSGTGGGGGGGINARARTVAYETDAERLPDEWFGYQAVDLLIMTTGTKNFTDDFCLGNTPAGEKRIAALTEWVRRGGHMVLSVSTKHQEMVHKFLQSPAWQPPFPNVLHPSKTEKLTEMREVQGWGGNKQFFADDEKDSIEVAVLQPDKAADILISDRKVPLMVRVPYGLGSVTLVAFELDRKPFTGWDGSPQFWQKLVNELGPKVRAQDDKNGLVQGGQNSNYDITTQLHRELEAFNVPMISFGWVALFIFLYILIVGPLDYLILKKVFKRLEWTWITFPAVVIGISVIAYFTAYALKGDQLKINKVDLIDIDMRTYLDKDYLPKKAYANGTTWFSLLSPRIQNYTIGVQPELGVWSEGAKGGAVMVTWMGRPETSDFNGTGKNRSAGLFRRAYDYAEDASGLKDVPIPVWTTKAFTAYWTGEFKQPPLTIDLHYEGVDKKVSGTVQNHLPFDLEDVYLLYNDLFYPLDRGLPAPKEGKAETITVKLSELQRNDMNNWQSNVNAAPVFDPQRHQVKQLFFLPTPLLKQMYFFDKLQIVEGNNRNHVHRPLDQSWRLSVAEPGKDLVRTAILVARIARAEGDSESLHAAKDPRLPTHLWLGALPEPKAARPTLSGTLVQDTYIRIFVAVRPKP